MSNFTIILLFIIRLRKIGVSRQTINSIEANRYVPSTVLALKLSDVFGKPVNDFFKLNEDD